MPYNVMTGNWEGDDEPVRPKLNYDAMTGQMIDEPVENGLEDINELRAAYFTKFKKRPFNGWDEATLREKMG